MYAVGGFHVLVLFSHIFVLKSDVIYVWALETTSGEIKTNNKTQFRSELLVPRTIFMGLNFLFLAIPQRSFIF